MVGIKGTGMAALAEIFQDRGFQVMGSDVEESFFTDQILRDRGIPFFKGFSASQVPENLDFAVRSAAYGEDHEEVACLLSRGVPLMTYPEALGALSRGSSAGAVAGVHGKTTTSALCGVLVKALSLPGTVLVGSAVPAFGDRATLIQGSDFFLAETCEYRRHFLNFSPDRMILTSVEADHLDYFKDLEDIENAFVELACRLSSGGTLIYCLDDPGARFCALKAKERRRDIRLIPYGFAAEGAGRVYRPSPKQGREGDNPFCLAGLGTSFTLQVPGEHIVLDAAAALLLVLDQMGCREEEGRFILTEPELEALERGIRSFTGTRRRSEIVGEAAGILIMDDYAHHPTAIRKTLEGFRAFYPQRRMVVDFMSHTYSRTAALLEDFASSFASADEVILHKIYSSAREEYNGRISGRDLYEKTCAKHQFVRYYEEPSQALDYLLDSLKEGDLFVTMGAGNNGSLGRELFRYLKERTP